MLFLSRSEKEQWAELGNAIRAGKLTPRQSPYQGRGNLAPAFHFYIGSFLAATVADGLDRQWLAAGAMIEDNGLFMNTFLTAFLERHQGQVVMPEMVFADPRPYVHFTTVPVIKESRRRFLTQCGHSLTPAKRPVRMLDIGCGDGNLTLTLLLHLREHGLIGDIAEVLLVDPSPAMLAMARDTVARALPDICINTLNARIEQVAGKLENCYDLAVCSLSYHHLPYAQKVRHLQQLKPHVGNLILFELDANNDLPELHSPELALSVYQSYGRLIDFVFAHDAPVSVAQDCVDRFLMTEVVSLLTEPRGKRNDYHMLRRQWLDLFDRVLAPEFELRCDSSCYEDDFFALFTIHYADTRRG